MREISESKTGRKVSGGGSSFGSFVGLFAVPWVLVVLATGEVTAQDLAGQEILYTGKEFAQPDTFEGLNLEDADKLFRRMTTTGGTHFRPALARCS